MSVSRRVLLRSVATAAGTLAAASLLGSTTTALGALAAPRRRRSRLEKLQILQVGVGGSIAPYDRQQLRSHPDVAFTGLCDVDSDALAAVAAELPEAFTCRDFREAFSSHGDRFDAVLVCTPDHNHAAVMLAALRSGKHCYGQKPLVQQLEEVALIEQAVAANPGLITQVGNQRMGNIGRQHAVDILRKHLLGKAVEAHVWIAGPPDEGNGYFYYGPLPEPSPPPANIDWPLWLGCAQDAPCREGLVGLRWRSSWDYGTGQLGDWCTHLLDVPTFAYDLRSPISVLSQTHHPSGFYHALQVQSTLAYPGGEHFANATFPVHYCDKAQAPSRAALGLPPGSFGSTGTLVVCEDGVLNVAPEGELEVWRDGKAYDWTQLDGLEERFPRNHWHCWADAVMGRPDAFVQTPFLAGAAMAEAGLLCAKAARFPNQELVWDKPNLRFTNHEEASRTIVRRAYRPGFGMPTAGA